MKGKQKIALCLVFLPLAIGLLAWWHWASQTVMRIKNYDTQHIYVEFPAKAGDRLFFGWIHSLEHIHWHEYFHIAPDHSLILDTISFPAFGAGIPENRGKKTWVDEKGNIFMDEIDQSFPRIDWINSHYATRKIKLNDELITSGRLLPEHTRLILVIEERGFFDGRFEESIHKQPYLGKLLQ